MGEKEAEEVEGRFKVLCSSKNKLFPARFRCPSKLIEILLSLFLHDFLIILTIIG